MSALGRPRQPSSASAFTGGYRRNCPDALGAGGGLVLHPARPHGAAEQIGLAQEAQVGVKHSSTLPEAVGLALFGPA